MDMHIYIHVYIHVHWYMYNTYTYVLYAHINMYVHVHVQYIHKYSILNIVYKIHKVGQDVIVNLISSIHLMSSTCICTCSPFSSSPQVAIVPS